MGLKTMLFAICPFQRFEYSLASSTVKKIKKILLTFSKKSTGVF